MICDSKINSINDLREKSIIDDNNVILDMDAFNIYNDKLSEFARNRYGVFDPVGSKFFSVQQREGKLLKGSTYLRDNLRKSYYIVANDGLFNAVQEVTVREEIEAEINDQLRDENYGIDYGDQEPPVFMRDINSPGFNNTADAKIASTIYELEPDITEEKIQKIYKNYVNLMGRAREGKEMSYKVFKSLINGYQVYNYKNTYIFGNWDTVNAVFVTRVNSSPTSKELLSEAIPKLVKSGLNFISLVPKDVADKYERSGYEVSSEGYQYNFKGEDMVKYAAISNPAVAIKIFGKPIDEVTSEEIELYSDNIIVNYAPVSINAGLIKKAGTDLSKILETYLNQFGIVVKDINQAKRQFGVDELGFADILSKVAYVRDRKDLPEVAGEFIAFMMQHNPLVKDIIVELAGVKAQKEYNNLDKSEYIKIIGDLITKDLQNKLEGNYSKSLIDRIKRLLIEFFNIVRNTPIDMINRNIGIISNNILQQNKNFITSSLYKPGAFGKPVSQINIEEALKKDKFGEIIVDTLSKQGFILTGSTALSEQGTILRPDENPLHDIDWVSPFSRSETLDRFLSVYPDAVKVREIIEEQEGIVTDSYVIAPEGHSIKNYVSNDYNGKIVIQSYDVVNSKGKTVGTYRLEQNEVGKNIEVAKGVEAKVIDLFSYKNYATQNQNQPFSYKTDDGKQIQLANWKNTFTAKLKFGRYKDIWDYNRYVPNENVIFFDNNQASTYSINEISDTGNYKVVNIGNNMGTIGKFIISNGNIATMEPIELSSSFITTQQKVELIKELGSYYLNQGLTMKSGPINDIIEPVWKNLEASGNAYKIEDQYYYTDKELDPYVRIIDVNESGFQIQRAKEVASILADRLARSLKVNYQLITPEEAKNILANRVIGYNGEAAFFFGGTAYFVGDNFNLETVLHEFSHPLLGAIRRENPELFQKLYEQLTLTEEGQALVARIQALYPELQNGSDLFKEEVIAHALQKAAVDKVNQEISSKGFLGFIQELLYHFKKLLRSIFPNKVEVSKLDVDTTLGELADMLLTKDFNYQTQLITNEDVVMFGKFSIERADELSKDISESSLQQLINSSYSTQLDLLRRARKFKSKSKEYKALQEALFQKGTRELLPTIARSLKPYQTATAEQRKDLTEEEIILDAIAAEERRLQNEKNRSLSYITSLETTLEIVKNIKSDLASILSEGRYDTRSRIALINVYQQQLEAYDLMVREINEVFENEGITTGSALTNLVNDIAAEIERAEKKISDIYENSNVDFYLDLTKYMQEFLENELKQNIQPIKQYLNDQEFEEFYDTAIKRELTSDEINALASKNVPIEIVSKFLDDYNFFKLDENRIKASLTGVAPDVRWGNRFLESYSSSNDPIVGGLAIFIQNQRTKAQQNALQKSREFRTKLPELLDAAGFSKFNVTALTDMLMSKDKILDFDEKGNPIEFEVYSYMNEFGNGYRYELDKLKYNVTEAEKKGDRQEIAAAKKELNDFINDYFWQEYLPEVYKVDEVFNESPVGKEAWLDMRTALDEYQAFNNSIDNELERFEKYSILQAKWDAYQRLFDLNYFDGSPKVDDPDKGIYDLSKALVLRQYREAKRKYYEFVPREGSLETAYNEFILEQEAKGLKRDSEEFKEAYDEWLKQNVKVIYAPEYYEAKKNALDTIRTLEEKKGKEDSTAPLFQEMMELLYGYRDEQGQPIPGSLGADRLLKINDLNQRINDIRANQERSDNLTSDQREELKSYVIALKNNSQSLTTEQMQRYVELTNMRKSDGLSTLEQAQLEGAYAELAELNSKLPTEYYMEALNFYLEKQNIPAVEANKVDDFINTVEFKDYLKADDEFAQWFGSSHVIKVKYNSFGRRYTVFERNVAYSVSLPSDDNQILKTEITDRSTGKTITIKGMPNARHSTYRVKSEYRSIPIGAERKDYIGKVINNRGEFLPRPFNPNNPNSAKDDRFINKDYMDLKKQGGARYELLEYMKQYHLYFQEGAAMNAKLYLDMPRYGVSDVVQKFQSGQYVDQAKRFAGTTKEWLKSTWGRAQDDFNRGYANYDPDKNVYVNTDPLNREIAYVPVTGLYKLKMDQVDMDLLKITGEYLMSIENQKVLIDSLPRVQSILKQLEDPRNNTKSGKFSKQTGKAASKRNARNNRLEQVRSLIDREYYGVQLSQNANQYVFLTKLMSNFSKLASFSSLALNIPSDLKNRYGQLAQNVIEASGGEFVNLKDLANARAWAFTTMIKWAATDIYAKGVPSLTAQIIENFDAVFKTEDQLGQSVSRSLYRDLMNGSWATDFRKSAEMEAALQLFGGYMKHQKVEQRTTDGKVIYLDYLDAWETDANGVIKLKDGVDPDYGTKAIDHVYTKGETLEEIAKMYSTTVEKLKERNKIDSTKDLEDGTELVITRANKFNEIKNRFHGLSRKLYGAYDAFGQPEGNKYMIYRMFFFMRKWFTPMFVNHFGMDTSAGNIGKARYDWAMGTTELGYYITAFSTLAKLLKTKGQYYNWMTAKEKAAFKKIGTQMMTIIALALVAAMVFGYDEDDEDRWDKISERSGGYINSDEFNTYGFLQNHILALTMGVMNETSTFLPIPKMYGVQFGLDDYVKFITSTGSIFNSTGKTYAQIIQNLADYLTGDAAAYYKRDTGPYWFEQEGELKLWRNLFKVVGYSGVTGDTETLIKNIEKSSIIR